MFKMMMFMALALVLGLRHRYLDKENLFTDVTPGAPELVESM